MPTKDLLLRVTGDSSSAEAALYRAEMAQRKYDLATRRAHGEMTADLDAASRRQTAAMDRIGTGFLAVGAAAGIGLGLAAKEAIQWESAFASVAKTFPGGVDALATLEEGLRDLALVLPASHEDIAAVAAAAGALGVKAPDILQFTHTMIDLGNATDDLDAQSAAVGLAQFMNVVGTAPEDVERLASTLVELGNNGASTEGQILEMAQRLAAAGKIAGLSEADILGMASALTSVGIEAEAGGSAFSRVFISIDDAVKSGNDSLQLFADVAGMSAAQFSAAFRDDAAGATVAFVEGIGNMSDAGASLTGVLEELELSDIRVRNALLSAAGASDLMTDALAISNAEFANGNALQDEVAKRYATTESKIKLAKNALTDAGIEIGSVLLPALSSMATTLSELLGWFSDLPEPVKATVTGLAGLAAVGGLVVGAGLKIQGALTRMNTQLAATPKLAAAATLGLKALGAAGIVGGLAAVAYAIVKIEDSFDTDKLKADIGQLSAELYRLGTTGESTGEIARVLGDDLSGLTDRIKGFGDGAVSGHEGITDFANDVTKTDAALANLVAGGDMEAVAKLLERTGLTAEEAAAAFPEMTAAMADNELRAGELAKEQAKLLDSSEDLTPAQQELADQFGLTGQEAKDAAEELGAYDDALRSIIDQLFGTQAAHDKTAEIWNDLRDKMADAAEAGVAFSQALTGDSEAAIENRARLVDLIDSYLLQIATWDQATMSSEDYDAALMGLRDDFILNAAASGMAEEAVEAFDDAMALLPPKVLIPVEQPGMPLAREQTGLLQDQLDALEGTTYHTIQVDTYYTEPTGYTGWQDLYGGDYSGGRSGGEAYGAGESGQRGYGSQERGGGTGTYSMPGWGGGGGYTVQRGGGGGSMAGGGMTNNINITHVEKYPVARQGAFDISGAARQVGRLGIDGIALGRVVVEAAVD